MKSKLMIIIFLCILIILQFSKIVDAEEVVINTDASIYKTVSPGDDAKFYWNIFNNETGILKCVVETTGENVEFSETFFILSSYEYKNVTHICHTNVSDENGTMYKYWVNWTCTYLVSSSEAHSNSLVTVIVINQLGSEDNLDGSNEQQKKSKTFIPGFEITSTIVMLGICALLVKRRKK